MRRIGWSYSGRRRRSVSANAAIAEGVRLAADDEIRNLLVKITNRLKILCLRRICLNGYDEHCVVGGSAWVIPGDLEVSFHLQDRGQPGV
jgi:hypothetical protein